jgi:hypothetical protein
MTAIAPALPVPRRPRAREDLEVHEQPSPDGTPVFRVKDLATRRFARLGPLHFSVLEVVENGEVPVEEIPRVLVEQHGITVGLTEVLNVLGELDTHQLLELTAAQLANHRPSLKQVRKALRDAWLPPLADSALVRGDLPGLLDHLLEMRERERQRGERDGRAGQAFLKLQAAVIKEASRDRSVMSRVRRMRLPLFDPTVILDRLVPIARRLAHPVTTILAVLMLLVAGLIHVNGHDALRADLDRLVSAPPLLLVLGTMLFTLFVHELSHGLACRYFGGEVREVGVMLMFLSIPAAYCDVSDAYRFTERRARIWVGAAGCVANVVLWILATLLWSTLDNELWVTRACLVIMATTGVGLLFNLNPLLPLDGYFVLCDVLGMENLRPRAQAYLFQWLSARFSGGTVPQVTARERRIFLGYGVGSLFYTVLILGGLLHVAFTRLVGTFRGPGVILFLFAFYLLFGGLFSSLWKWLRARPLARVEVLAVAALLVVVAGVLLAWV